ncbi:hypothetical protein ACP275_12G046200 [Erythranthe tilingii]
MFFFKHIFLFFRVVLKEPVDCDYSVRGRNLSGAEFFKNFHEFVIGFRMEVFLDLFNVVYSEVESHD